MSTLEPNVQHLRIKVTENAKHEKQVEVSATSVTGDKFILKEDRTDVAKTTSETPLAQLVAMKFFETHAELNKIEQTKSE